jgi:hypothetical protein
MIIGKIAFFALIVSQLTLLALYVLLTRSIADLRHDSHKHTFWFKNGEKVEETISSYEYMETHYE